MPTSRYDGPERRKDVLQLDEALAEVQKLNDATSTLAQAVVNTAQRHELEALSAEVARDFKVKLYFIAGIAVVSLVILMVFFNWRLSTQAKQIDKGHQVLSCLLTQPEVNRTGQFGATALVTCQQSVR